MNSTHPANSTESINSLESANSSTNLSANSTIQEVGESMNSTRDIIYLLLIFMYAFLIIAHIYTICKCRYHKLLISPFSIALFTQACSISLTTIARMPLIFKYPASMEILEMVADYIHIISINFFILFLLIVAKGWPITRHEVPSKYAFIIFWVACLSLDLTFYTLAEKEDESLAKAHALPRRLSLGLRVVIMIYFLLELRSTVILEQEQKKLKFYLHFGALSMVWFVHSIIVYIIALRVDIRWQIKLITGFTSAANFLAFAFTTHLLWPASSRSQLFFTHQEVDNSEELYYYETDDSFNQTDVISTNLAGVENQRNETLKLADVTDGQPALAQNETTTFKYSDGTNQGSTESDQTNHKSNGMS